MKPEQRKLLDSTLHGIILKTQFKTFVKMSYMSKNKKSTKKNGLLPEKEAEATPWEKLCVDLIIPYKIKNFNNNQDLTLCCLTMIDAAMDG